MESADTEQQAASGNAAAQVQHARTLLAAGRTAESEAWLRRAADTGHIDAMAELGQLLFQSPVSGEKYQEGLKLILAAGDAGHAATKQQLALLLGDKADTTKLTEAPALKVLSQSPLPLLAVSEGFVSPAICDWIVARASTSLRPARTYDHVGGAATGTVSSNRTNSEMYFAGHELDLVLAVVRQRITGLSGLPLQSLEDVGVLHYTAGQEFKPHYDFLDPAVAAYAQDIGRRGQRIVTILVYLNDDFDGGETNFPLIGQRFKGRKGDALFFRNVNDAGAPDFRTLHAGLAPTRGEKWLLSQWARGPAAGPRA